MTRLKLSMNDLARVNEEISSSSMDQMHFVEVDHGQYAESKKNLIQIAATNAQVKDSLYGLAGRGFHLYKSDDTTSWFVAQRKIVDLWHRVRQGELSVADSGLIYTMSSSIDIDQCKSMLVIFSSMADDLNKSSLNRYFEPNFKSVHKFVPDDTLVLRIADIGGVVGGFYMPTTFDPLSASKVSNLIEAIISRHGIDRKRVVLYGASKGGTGSLYHAMMSGLTCVSVDPVVHDSFYEQTYNDSHWTAGSLFTLKKEEEFNQMVTSYSSRERADYESIGVVCSPRSPLFDSITEFTDKIPQDSARVFISNNPKIDSHPGVSRETLRTVTGLINSYLLGIRTEPGKVHF